MNKIVIPFVLLLFFILSCSKTELQVKDVGINGNVPPPDHTIDSSEISIYINKAYINLTGREPSPAEKSDALSVLRQHNFSTDDRRQFVNTLFAKDEYLSNLYNVANNEFLRSLDSSEIELTIFQLNYLLSQPQNAPFYGYLHFELYRIDTLKTVMDLMRASSMDYRGMLSRMTNNYFYDQINMGSENFVVSTYQNFLFRYPSNAELLAGKTMVDGNTSTVFLKTGKSKYDYIHIFFDTDDYYEGQVRFIFKKYLFREPLSAEIYLYSAIYKNSNDYRELQRAVYTSDEYAGI